MKHLALLLILSFSFGAKAAVPTEEGLLKNLNNASIPGNLITIKAMVQGPEVEGSKVDYYKFHISLENPNIVSVLQLAYSSGQMLNTQLKDVKYISDLQSAIKRDKSPERSLYFAALMMLSANKPGGMEAFLEKNGVQIVRNKNILNEEKMKLLRSYRSYLANNKGKSDANSPLNPSDPANKAKVIELFRANTFERAKNIELTKIDNEFVWKVDWKSTQAYFTNEDRRLRRLDYLNSDINVRIDASEYIMFNGTNELPKLIFIKDSKGLVSRVQILGLDTKVNREKKINERFDEMKKALTAPSPDNYSFLY